MELKRDEIVKALECCIKAESWGDCEEMGCPAHTKQGCHFYLRTDDDYENTIYIELCKDALSLIKELTEERDGFENLIYTMSEIENRMSETIEELTEENEMLKLKVGAYQVKDALLSNQLDDKCDMCIARERADTVREMRKEIEARCIKGGIYPAFVRSTIEQIAREMIGGENGNKED